MRTIYIFILLVSSCSTSSTSNISSDDSWTLVRETQDSVFLTYAPGESLIKSHFENKSECYSEGWILCPYVTNADLILLKSGQTIVDAYQMSDAATIIDTSFTWKLDENVISFDADYFITAPSKDYANFTK